MAVSPDRLTKDHYGLLGPNRICKELVLEHTLSQPRLLWGIRIHMS